jgi:hypothetical protein
MNISINGVGEINVQSVICRIINNVYHKSNGHIFITCTKYLTKSEWLYSRKHYHLHTRPSAKLVRGIMTSFRTQRSLHKYKISVKNNDGNRQLGQCRHNEKIWALFNWPLQNTVLLVWQPPTVVYT